MVADDGLSRCIPVAQHGYAVASCFLADARRAAPSRAASPSSPTGPKADDEGLQVVARQRSWRHTPLVAPPPLPPAPRRPMPTNLIGCCFNCLRTDHIAAVCPNAARCLRCHREGHQACHYKRPHSPDVVSPSRRLQRSSDEAVIVLNPRGDVALGASSSLPRWAQAPLQSSVDRGVSSGSSSDRTPSSCETLPTPKGSSPRHILPSPPPSSPPLGVARCRPRFETSVIPHTAAVDAAEAKLATTLVAMVASPRPTVSTSQVMAYLDEFFQVPSQEVRVRRSNPDDFLLVFSCAASADHVLHVPPPAGAAFNLRFRRWRW
jgi:hypothetical protein